MFCFVSSQTLSVLGSRSERRLPSSPQFGQHFLRNYCSSCPRPTSPGTYTRREGVSTHTTLQGVGRTLVRARRPRRKKTGSRRRLYSPFSCGRLFFRRVWGGPVGTLDNERRGVRSVRRCAGRVIRMPLTGFQLCVSCLEGSEVSVGFTFDLRR